MTDDWVRLCRGAKDMTVEPPQVEVSFHAGRRHRVTVVDAGKTLQLTAIIVRQAVVASMPDLSLQAWTRNRASRLVGFRIDDRGRLVGESWVPKVGLLPDEFQLYVRTLAAECDRFELALTGRDVE